MRRTFHTSIILLLCISFPSSAKPAGWSQKMQDLGKTFSELLPELAENRPITPATRRQLEKGVTKLLKLSHAVHMDKLPPDADPTLAMVSELFDRDVKAAAAALKAGHVEYARSALRQVGTYCIACHSRSDSGPSFPTLTLTPRLESLTALQRGELLAATRQFDAALKEFETIAADTNFAKRQPLEWARAVRHGLTLAVRVKKDAQRAGAIVDLVAAAPRQPGFPPETIALWKRSIDEWKAEPPLVANTEEGLFIEAVRLTDAAKAKQENAFSRAGDIYYLRSTAVLHELMSKYPKGSRLSEALFMAGNAYDVLDDRILSPISDLYYEGCIRKSPHSEMAQKCYARYERNTLFGYARSAGAFVTDALEKRMLDLRELSEVKESGK